MSSPPWVRVERRRTMKREQHPPNRAVTPKGSETGITKHHLRSSRPRTPAARSSRASLASCRGKASGSVDGPQLQRVEAPCSATGSRGRGSGSPNELERERRREPGERAAGRQPAQPRRKVEHLAAHLLVHRLEGAEEVVDGHRRRVVAHPAGSLDRRVRAPRVKRQLRLAVEQRRELGGADAGVAQRGGGTTAQNPRRTSAAAARHGATSACSAKRAAYSWTLSTVTSRARAAVAEGRRGVVVGDEGETLLAHHHRHVGDAAGLEQRVDPEAEEHRIGAARVGGGERRVAERASSAR